MSKTASRSAMSVKTLVGCALFTAIAVLLARMPFLSFAPTESTRYSLETLAILLAGLLYGPLAGALVGFASDFLGCVLLSPYGYNPLLCLPPILLGLWAGFRRRTPRQPWLRIALALLPPIALGYVLLQSAALTLVYQPSTFAQGFIVRLGARGIQYGIIAAIDWVLAGLLLPLLRKRA